MLAQRVVAFPAQEQCLCQSALLSYARKALFRPAVSSNIPQQWALNTPSTFAKGENLAILLISLSS